MSDFEQNLAKSFQFRNTSACAEKLSGKTNVQRLCAGLSDGIPGVIIDQLGALVVVQDYVAHKTPEAWNLLLKALLPDHQHWIKVRDSKGPFTYIGPENIEFIAEESGDQFLVKPTQMHDLGLFVDTKSARNWVRNQAKGKNILNLFAYTCAFAIAAKTHGAQQVTNIDPCEEYGIWGKRNGELNHVEFKFFADTTQKYMPRHLRRLERQSEAPYDLIITDPPAFLVGRGDDRLGRKIWPSMLSQMVQSQAPQLLLICNDRSFRSTRSWAEFLDEHLNGAYDLTPLPQSPDVLGQSPKTAYQDPHYSPPLISIAAKR